MTPMDIAARVIVVGGFLLLASIAGWLSWLMLRRQNYTLPKGETTNGLGALCVLGGLVALGAAAAFAFVQ